MAMKNDTPQKAAMRELYDINISDNTISRNSEKILPTVKEWQERLLEEIYAVVFLDAIHFHVRSGGHIVKQNVYIAIGIDMLGENFYAFYLTIPQHAGHIHWKNLLWYICGKDPR